MTDMRRGESVLELDVCVQEEIELGIEIDGSNLSGVSARCSWVEADPDQLSPCLSGLFYILRLFLLSFFFILKIWQWSIHNTA